MNLATMLTDFARLGGLDLAMTEAELRPLWRDLLARERRCDRCGRGFIQKRNHQRQHSFCRDSCRNRKPAEVREAHS